jgi:hypothetical protein
VLFFLRIRLTLAIIKLITVKSKRVLGQKPKSRKVQKKEALPVLLPIINDSGKYIFFCPGCSTNHLINTNRFLGQPCHKLTGPLSRPTVRASILSIGDEQLGKPHCHSFITEGRITFMQDCTHRLAGQTIDMEPM